MPRFDGDGVLDLAVANAGGNSVSILPGNPDGTFRPIAYDDHTGTRPVHMVVGDFNGDGRPDLAIASNGSNNVSILINNAPEPSIYYPDFSSIAGLNLIGDATQFSDRLRLTPDVGHRRSAAWYTQAQNVEGRFQTTFQFQITHCCMPNADGFAFVIQNSGDSALGDDGSCKRYGEAPYCSSRPGIANSLAIQFDAFHMGSLISVQTRGRLPNSPDPAFSLGSTTDIPLLGDGKVRTARILYVPGTMEIFLDDFASPILTVPVDLAELLDLSRGRAFVGFTAATGDFTENHDLLNWSFVSGSAAR